MKIFSFFSRLSRSFKWEKSPFILSGRTWLYKMMSLIWGEVRTMPFTRTIQVCIWKNDLFGMSIEQWVILYIGEIAPLTFIIFKKILPYFPSGLRLEKNRSCKSASLNTQMHSWTVSKLEKVKEAAREMMKTRILMNWFFSSLIPEGGKGTSFSKKMKVHSAISPIYRIIHFSMLIPNVWFFHIQSGIVRVKMSEEFVPLPPQGWNSKKVNSSILQFSSFV